MRLICVRATNPSGRTIELGILTDDADRPAQELIWLMFHRWLQENDFKYMEKHFGINQITSYASYSYEEIAKSLEDRQVKSGEYKALQKGRQAKVERISPSHRRGPKTRGQHTRAEGTGYHFIARRLSPPSKSNNRFRSFAHDLAVIFSSISRICSSRVGAPFVSNAGMAA